MVSTKGLGICINYRSRLIVATAGADKAQEMSFLLAGLFDRLTKSGRGVLVKEPDPPEDRRRHPRESTNAAALLQWIDEHDQDNAECVYIADVSAGGCRLRLTHTLEPGWPVLITPHDKPPFKAVVRHCHPEGEGWSIGAQMIRNDRRRVDRRPLSCPASLRWHEGPRECTATVMIRNASDGGVQIACPQAVTTGTFVTLSHEGWLRPATVCYSTQQGEDWLMGLQFTGMARPVTLASERKGDELEAIV